MSDVKFVRQKLRPETATSRREVSTGRGVTKGTQGRKGRVEEPTREHLSRRRVSRDPTQDDHDYVG